jgi:hypothetical protein
LIPSRFEATEIAARAGVRFPVEHATSCSMVTPRCLAAEAQLRGCFDGSPGRYHAIEGQAEGADWHTGSDPAVPPSRSASPRLRAPNAFAAPHAAVRPDMPLQAITGPHGWNGAYDEPLCGSKVRRRGAQNTFEGSNRPRMKGSVAQPLPCRRITACGSRVHSAPAPRSRSCSPAVQNERSMACPDRPASRGAEEELCSRIA